MSDELKKALEPKSDRLNADDLVGGPRVITITAVAVHLLAKDGNITINYDGDNGRPWKPAKTMGRALAEVWGYDEQKWVGKRVELFRDPDVMFGTDPTGGVRIAALSHIDSNIVLLITTKRGKRTRLPIRKLPDAPARQPAPAHAAAPAAIDVAPYRASLAACAARGMAELRQGWGDLPAEIRAAIDPTGCPADLKEIAKAADAAPNAPADPATTTNQEQ